MTRWPSCRERGPPLVDQLRKGHAAAHRLNRAVAPIIGAAALFGMGFSAYQLDRMESRITQRIDRLEDRMERRAERAELPTEKPAPYAAK